MKKFIFSLVAMTATFNLSSKAQTIEEGKKFYYYERYNSAKEVFQKLLNVNPNNEEAIYWLGQSIIAPDDHSTKDIAEVKSMYQSKLSVSNSQLLMAGIGHVELLEGKAMDAKNHFDAAIQLSQSKSIAVLSAIGFANSNPDVKEGDAAYAIEKLKMATLLKKFNDPDVYVNLGDAYRKLGDGGNAILSYQAALTLNPKFARANFRMGKLYQSQGRGQESIFMEYFDKAIADDPAYAPVYSNLFNYFYETNVTKAAEYFEKWQANSDKDYKSCYYRAALKYAQGFFMDAISMSDACIAESADNPYANLFGLKANAYNRLKDSINAITNFEMYFQKQVPEKITAGDYFEYAKNLIKIPGKETNAINAIDKAVLLDSLESNKVQYLKFIAQAFEARKNFVEAANFYNKIIAVKKSPSKYDLNTAAFNYYKGAAFQQSIDIFKLSGEKFPDDPYAFNMIGKASWAIDTTMQLGLANEAFEKTIQVGIVDSVKYKPQLLTAYRYFVAYNANIKKDREATLLFTEKILALEPNDAEALSNKQILTAPAKKTTADPKTKPVPAKKP
jgi:tetratricopeptide (TPR) repeat protein